MPWSTTDSEFLLGFQSLDEVEVSTNNISRIPVMPVGEYSHPTAGALSITEDDLRLLADDINTKGDRIPVDFDHSFRRGRGSLAAGWFVPGSASIENGMLTANVEWTTDAAEDIRAKRYRFISPEWTFDKKTPENKMRKPSLMAAALTNRPFFQNMPAVMLADRGLDEILGPEPVELLTEMEMRSAAEWLVSDASELMLKEALAGDREAKRAFVALAQVKARAEKFRTDNQGEEMDISAVAEMVGLAADASEEEVQTALAEMKAKAEKSDELQQEKAELEKQLPKDGQLQTLIASAAKGEAAAKELHDMKRETLLNKAIEERKILPAQKEHYASLFDLDPNGVSDLIESIQASTFAPVGSEGKNDTQVVTGSESKFQSELAEVVNKESVSIHEKAMEILKNDGKLLDHSGDDYLRAVTLASEELGLSVHDALA